MIRDNTAHALLTSHDQGMGNMNTDDVKHSGRRLTTIPNMARMPGYREAFTGSSLRHQIFHAKSRTNSKGQTIRGNGLEEAGAIIRIGRKVIIDLDRYDAWLVSKRASAEEVGS